MTAAVATRGTTNRNARGSTKDRAARRAWLIGNFAANVDLDVDPDGQVVEVPRGHGLPACRCYRCGLLLTDLGTAGTRAVPERHRLTVDRIIPGVDGGTYRRNNIRPACAFDNESTGGALACKPKRRLAVAR